MARSLYNRRSQNRLWGTSISQTRGEIDLREEIHEILFGSSFKPQRGHWVVYRRFNLNEKSNFYDEVYNTGVGGPVHTYTDTLVMSRRDPIFAAEDNEASAPPGIIEGGRYIYYFEYDFIPRIQDQIFEIDWSDHTVTPTLAKISTPYIEKYNIKEIYPYRADAGRIEYWSIYVNKDLVNY